MKAVTVVGLLLTLAQLSTSLKDPMCGLKPVSATCWMYSSGFTYIPSENTCTPIKGPCLLPTTNFFHEKERCEAKCKE